MHNKLNLRNFSIRRSIIFLTSIFFKTDKFILQNSSIRIIFRKMYISLKNIFSSLVLIFLVINNFKILEKIFRPIIHFVIFFFFIFTENK